MRTYRVFDMRLNSSALISCSDKSNLSRFAKHLIKDRNLDIISTGGSYTHLRSELTNNLKYRLHKLEDVIQYPEILRGRVKSLHPRVLGGILANKSSESDMNDIISHGLLNISWVVCNLYPFNSLVGAHTSLKEALELIDIGGVSMIRAAAKNFPHVTIITDPSMYDDIIDECTELTFQKRAQLAKAAFRHTSKYDEYIVDYLSKHETNEKEIFDLTQTVRVNLDNTQAKKAVQIRKHTPVYQLKYGCNPHQTNSFISQVNSNRRFPIDVLNGNPSYINFLDALRGWQLVKELSTEFGEFAAASMKHTSPAGAAISVELDKKHEKYLFNDVYHTNVPEDDMTSTYIRARNSDPLSSFGDFIAVSHPVSRELAEYLKGEVSDGIIAPEYDSDALEILKKKKKGGFVILQINPLYYPKDSMEYREMYGIGFAQSRNTTRVTQLDLQHINNEDAIRDLVLASLVLKYAESNTISVAYQGQLIGLGSGQQSRIHATKLALEKARLWTSRHDPILRALMNEFVSEDYSQLSRQDRVNAETKFFDRSSFSESSSISTKNALFNPPLSLASDAFFPFRDNIDVISQSGVKYIAQPGGSVRDAEIFEACKEHGIDMVCHSKRMFTH